MPAGTINTVAGTLGTACASYSTPATACGNGGPATATGAYLNYPSGVTVDSSDDIYIADTSDFAVREVVESSGNITAFAGNSFLSYSGDGGSATAAELGFPGSTFLDASGNVYIADTYNQVIRVLNTGTSSITINGVTIAAGWPRHRGSGGTPPHRPPRSGRRREPRRCAGEWSATPEP